MEEALEHSPTTNFGRLRVWGLQGKLIIPYAMLTLVLAAVGIFVITRLVTSEFRERFINQLYNAADVSTDAIGRQEKENLDNLRLVAFTQGVPEAIATRDIEQLELLLLPLVMNYQLDTLTLVDSQGIEIVTFGRVPEDNSYRQITGTDLSDNDFVSKVVSGVIDEQGDKYVGVLETNFGLGMFTGVAVADSRDEIVGGVFVGKYLDDIVAEIEEQAMAGIVVFDNDKKILASTLMPLEEDVQNLDQVIRSMPEDELQMAHDLELMNREYQITFAPYQARGERFGWLGVALPSSYVVATEATSRNVFSFIFAGGTIAIILIGFILSRSIAKPILKLSSLTQAVAAGDLEQEIGIRRSDEIGELAVAFDQMTLRLRERTNEAARLYAEAIQRNKELAEINTRLKETQSQLIQSEKMGAIGQLAAGIVHDIKNPLTVVKGVAELMLSDDHLPDEFDQETKLIYDSATKAIDIVSDLMKFARQSELEMGNYDIRGSIDSSLRLAAFQIRKAHVQLVKDLPEEPVMVTYDNRQIEQVLLNLVHNAVQAMPDGGTLRVNLSQADNVVAIAIQDTGTGIPPEIVNRIFDPFFTTKPEGEGTGLGLSVSYGIVSHHNGRIAVDSEVGEGTTFTILLPLEPLPDGG